MWWPKTAHPSCLPRPWPITAGLMRAKGLGNGGVGEAGGAVLRENVSAAPLWLCISKSPSFHYDTRHNSLDNISQFISLVIFKISVGNHIHLNFSRVFLIIILLFAQSSERICVFKRCMRHSASPADKETTQPMTNSASWTDSARKDARPAGTRSRWTKASEQGTWERGGKGGRCRCLN